MTVKRLLLVAAPVALAAGSLLATAHPALAYPSPSCAINVTNGSATTAANGTSTFTFQVLDAAGAAATGQSITFSEGGVAGSLNPTSATSNGSGEVSTTFTAGSALGTATVTASDAAGACSGSASTNVGGGGVLGTSTGGVLGISTTAGSGALPDTSASAPPPSTLIFAGLGLALVILVGGAVALRRSREAVS